MRKKIAFFVSVTGLIIFVSGQGWSVTEVKSGAAKVTETKPDNPWANAVPNTPEYQATRASFDAALGDGKSYTDAYKTALKTALSMGNDYATPLMAAASPLSLPQNPLQLYVQNWCQETVARVTCGDVCVDANKEMFSAAQFPNQYAQQQLAQAPRFGVCRMVGSSPSADDLDRAATRQAIRDAENLIKGKRKEANESDVPAILTRLMAITQGVTASSQEDPLFRSWAAGIYDNHKSNPVVPLDQRKNWLLNSPQEVDETLNQIKKDCDSGAETKLNAAIPKDCNLTQAFWHLEVLAYAYGDGESPQNEVTYPRKILAEANALAEKCKVGIGSAVINDKDVRTQIECVDKGSNRPLVKLLVQVKRSHTSGLCQNYQDQMAKVKTESDCWKKFEAKASIADWEALKKISDAGERKYEGPRSFNPRPANIRSSQVQPSTK